MKKLSITNIARRGNREVKKDIDKILKTHPNKRVKKTIKKIHNW